MEIKGTAVKTIPEYIKTNYSENFDTWFELLPEASKKIFAANILSTKWYQLDDAIVIPMEILSEILSIDEKKLAWDLGVYSSKSALTGVYKVFVRIASTSFIIKRAANMLQAYYRPSEVKLYEQETQKAVFEFINFLKADHILMQRIAGWSKNTFDAVGAKNVEVKLKDIKEGENFSTLMVITWE